MPSLRTAGRPRFAERVPFVGYRPRLVREPIEPPAQTAYASSLVAAQYGRRDLWLRRALAVGDALAVTLALAIAAQAPGKGTGLEFAAAGILTIPVWTVLFRMYGLYDRDVRKLSHTSVDDVPSVFHAFVIGTLLLWLYYKVMPTPQLELEQVIVFAVSGFILVLLTRIGTRAATTRVLGPERVLLVGGGPSTGLLARKMASHPEYNLDPVGLLSGNGEGAAASSLPVIDDPGGVDLAAVVQEHSVERVVISHLEVEEDTMLDLVRRCKELGVKVSLLPQLFDALGPSVEVDDVEGVTVLGINPPVLPRSARMEKRGLDLIVAGTLFVMLAPILALVALVAIKLDSRGPVFFRQQRIGKGGRRFDVLKFRTMVVDAEQQLEGLRDQSLDPNWLKLERDPRITRVGRLLRHLSLDELPQLWNVLKGEMSLVGPRPLIESEDRMIGGWGAAGST